MAIGYQIKTFHDTVLCTDKGLIRHSKMSLGGACLYLFFLDDESAIVIPESNIQKLIASENDFTLFRYAKEFSVPALLCIVKNCSKNEPLKKKITLVHPKYRYLFSAVALGNDGIGNMKPDAYVAQNWEKFELIKPTQFDSRLDAYINSFKPTFFPKSTHVLQSLIDKDYIRFLNYMNLVSNEELSDVAHGLLNNPVFATKLAQMFDKDILVQHLCSHIQKKDIYSDRGNFYINTSKKSCYSIGVEYDFLGELYACDISKSPSQLLLSYVRGLIKPSKQYSTSVVTTIRNEGPYIVEFVAYYKSIGFDKIYIYSNNNNDNSDKLLNLLAKYGYITYINNDLKDGGGPQRKAYMHAATLNFDVLENDWTLFVDIDEFFTFNSALYKDVKDYLMYMNTNRIDSICLNWVVVGANERAFYNMNETTLDSYKEGNHVSPQVKSFVRTNKIGSLQCHFPFAMERDMLASVHANGKVQKSYKFNQGPMAKAFSDDLDINHASVIHYWSRSLYEFIYKYSKSRGAHPLNSATASFAGLDENFAKTFVSRFDVSRIDLDKLIGANKEKMKKYIQDIYAHDDIAQMDMEIKKNFDMLTKTAVRKFVDQFANTNVDGYKKLIDLLMKYK